MVNASNPTPSPEVRAMLADMGIRHPLDCSLAERDANMAAQRERIASAAERAGNAAMANSERRIAARLRGAA